MAVWCPSTETLAHILIAQAYKDKNLPEERIKALDDLGFDWTVKYQKNNKKQTNWDKRFEELIEYKNLHGNVNVPKSYEKNPLLGAWACKFISQLSSLALFVFASFTNYGSIIAVFQCVSVNISGRVS